MTQHEINDLVNTYIGLLEEIELSEHDDDHLTVVNQVLSQHMDLIRCANAYEEFTKELLAVKAERLAAGLKRMIDEEDDFLISEKLSPVYKEVQDFYNIARYGI